MKEILHLPRMISCFDLTDAAENLHLSLLVREKVKDEVTSETPLRRSFI